MGSGYERQPAGQFRRVDRHDCDAGRLDAGPYPDIVCSVGGERGVGIKANEKYSASTVAEHLRDNALYMAFAPADKPTIAVALEARLPRPLASSAV